MMNTTNEHKNLLTCSVCGSPSPVRYMIEIGEWELDENNQRANGRTHICAHCAGYYMVGAYLHKLPDTDVNSNIINLNVDTKDGITIEKRIYAKDLVEIVQLFDNTCMADPNFVQNASESMMFAVDIGDHMRHGVNGDDFKTNYEHLLNVRQAKGHASKALVELPMDEIRPLAEYYAERLSR